MFWFWLAIIAISIALLPVCFIPGGGFSGAGELRPRGSK